MIGNGLLSGMLQYGIGSGKTEAMLPVKNTGVLLEQIPGGAVAQMGPELLGQLRENRHIPALAPLRFGDEDHLLVKEHIIDLDVHELRHPRAGHHAGDRLLGAQPQALGAVEGHGSDRVALIAH